MARSAGDDADNAEVGDGREAWSVMRGDSDISVEAGTLVALIEELHCASSDAAAEGFPLMARTLDECGFAFARDLADDRGNEHELVERAQKCLEMWRAVRDW